MAYETGTAESPSDLVLKVRDFAKEQGWSVDSERVVLSEPLAAGYELFLSRGDCFFALRSLDDKGPFNLSGTSYSNTDTVRGIVVSGHDGYTVDTLPEHQPGAASSEGLPGIGYVPLVEFPGPYPSYHLFSPNPDCIYCELEASSGIYVRFGFGKLDTFSSSAPGDGRFFYGTASCVPFPSTSSKSWLSNFKSPQYSAELVPFGSVEIGDDALWARASWVRVKSGSFDQWAPSSRNIIAGNPTAHGSLAHESVLLLASPTPRTGFSILLNNTVGITTGDGFLSPIGSMAGFRFVNVYQCLSGNELVYGDDTWKIFPWLKKDGITGARGVAYLKE